MNASDNVIEPVMPLAAVHSSGEPALTTLSRVRYSDIFPYEGAPAAAYIRGVETLLESLMKHNAAIIQLGSEDSALMRCGLESSKLYFRHRAREVAIGVSSQRDSRAVFAYRAGRVHENIDSSPPCMPDIFRCMGKVARAALCSIAKHLRLRSDVFNHLLDDTPLSGDEVSSSVLLASYTSLPSEAVSSVSSIHSKNREVEKGLLALISSDNTGLEVCDPDGRWYLADWGFAPGDLLLITGKALSHVTAGQHPAASYRTITDRSSYSTGGRTTLMFRLIPRGNAVLDCSPVAEAGHVTFQSYVPVSVSQFMDDISAEEVVPYNYPEDYSVIRDIFSRNPSLRTVLFDSLSGAPLEDATVVSCGHSFGGLMLRRVIERSRCTLCNAEIDVETLIPNHALRDAASVFKDEDSRRLFHKAAAPKRHKNENFHMVIKDGLHKGVRYPFSVCEKVIITGNRRTPDKFVGKEAVITSQCLNGWYLLEIIGSGEKVRLQYRSLRKASSSQTQDDTHQIQSSNQPLPIII